MGKNQAAAKLARLRAESLTPERRSEIARKAGLASAAAKKRKQAAQPQAAETDPVEV